MTTQEIETASKDWSDNFDSNIPEFRRIKQEVSELSYREAAKMVNEKQPFSKDSAMQLFFWMIRKGWTMFDEYSEVFYHKDSYKAKKFDDLIEMWENDKK